MKIWAIDTHAHFSNKQNYEDNARGRQLIADINNLRHSVGFHDELKHAAVGVEDLLEEMEQNNIRESWLHQLSFSHILGYDVLSNAEIAAALRKYPAKFKGFAGINPHATDNAINEIHYWHEKEGFHGIKFNPNDYGGYYLNDKVLMYPLFEECCKLTLPVSFHTGLTPGILFKLRYNDPIVVDDIASDFPELTIIMEHMGHPWENIAYDILCRRLNVYITITAIANILIHNNPQVFSMELAKMIKMFGSQRILWGSDWTATPNTSEVLDFIRNRKPSLFMKITGLGGLSSDDRFNILYNNAKMIFNEDPG